MKMKFKQTLDVAVFVEEVLLFFFFFFDVVVFVVRVRVVVVALRNVLSLCGFSSVRNWNWSVFTFLSGGEQ